METILITGNAGLIGSRLASYIIERYGNTVIGIDDFSGGYEENVHEKVIQYKRNLTEDISDIFDRHKPDIVYHFAAYAAEGLSPFIRMFNYKTNLITTANIINNCIKHKIKRLVFTSSMSVYGHGDIFSNEPFDETLKPNPIDPYGISKYACEMDIAVAGDQHGLDWCILRPHNVYGASQNIWDKYRNVLGIWMYQRLNGEQTTIYGDGTQVRAFSYIDDILEPLWKAGFKKEASKQIINIGGTFPITIKEANDIFKKIAGGDTIFLEKRHEVHTAVPSFEKSIKILDYQQKTSLYDGLTFMWDWAKKQPERERFKWNNYEINDKIYKFWL